MWFDIFWKAKSWMEKLMFILFQCLDITLLFTVASFDLFSFFISLYWFLCNRRLGYTLHNAADFYINAVDLFPMNLIWIFEIVEELCEQYIYAFEMN